MNFNHVKFETSFGNSAQLGETDKLEIAFAGRSNVGKSTLINKIFNRKKLARVSSMPGKTATINFFTLENLIFADLPGYGYAKVAKNEQDRWSKLIDSYFNTNRSIALVFQLVDMRHPPSKDDVLMINFLIEREIPFVVVLTKQDKLSGKQQAERLQAFQTEIPCGDQVTMIPFSSQTGEGVEQIKAIICEVAEMPLIKEETEE